jgi:SAM-dependent methyltransferase
MMRPGAKSCTWPDRTGTVTRHRCERYELEPFLPAFARPEEALGLDVLEIGVGLGADHQLFAQAGARLLRIDLTGCAVAHARKRVALFKLESDPAWPMPSR